MPELLLQSALAASKSQQLAAEAEQIKANCHAQHGDNKPLVSCPQCYGTLLEALRGRFLSPTSATSAAPGQPPQQQQQQQREWFTTRRAFLSELDLLLNSAKEYQTPPHAIDDRVREERSRWYAESVRGALLRLLVEDPSSSGAAFEKLEDLSSAAAGSDPVALAREVAEILGRGPLAPGQGGGAGVGLPQRLAAASDDVGKVGVLEEVFFRAEDGSVPEEHQKYLDMLLHQGLSMEQVVDRILEERQAAAGAKEQTSKLNQRLDELRRARAAHEAQKTRKAQRRESLAQQKVPDELYDLPPCAVCGEAPRPGDFLCCSICTILAEAGVREKQTVFCSDKCEQQGYAAHLETTHTCSAALDCIQLNHHSNSPQPNPTTTNTDQDTPMTDAPMTDAPASAPAPAPAPQPSNPSHPSTNPSHPNPAQAQAVQAASTQEIHLCTECLTTLKHPTTYCTLACAAAHFQQHREEVHLPARQKLGLMEGGDEAGLVYLDQGGDGDGNSTGRYRARDIGKVVIGLGEAVGGWEGRFKVRLEGV